MGGRGDIAVDSRELSRLGCRASQGQKVIYIYLIYILFDLYFILLAPSGALIAIPTYY